MSNLATRASTDRDAKISRLRTIPEENANFDAVPSNNFHQVFWANLDKRGQDGVACTANSLLPKGAASGSKIIRS